MTYYSEFLLGPLEDYPLSEYYEVTAYGLSIDGVVFPANLSAFSSSDHETVTARGLCVANAWLCQGDVVWTYARDKQVGGRNCQVVPPSHLFRFRASAYENQLGGRVTHLPTITRTELLQFFVDDWIQLSDFRNFIEEFGGWPQRPSQVEDWNGLILISMMLAAIERTHIEYWPCRHVKTISTFEVDVATNESDLMSKLSVSVLELDNGKLGLHLVIDEDRHELELKLRLGTCVVLTSDSLSSAVRDYLQKCRSGI